MKIFVKHKPCGRQGVHGLRKKLLMMGSIGILLVVCTLHSSANVTTRSESVKISLDMDKSTVHEVLSAIEKESSFYFTYNSKQINDRRKVSIHAKNLLVTDILDELFAGEGVKYTIHDKHIVLYKAETLPDPAAVQQSRRITGVVVDTGGEPIIGANVLEKGTTNGTVTNVDGQFTLEVAVSGAALQVSYIGYVTQEINVSSATGGVILS
jgi:hypothetical protein